MNVILGKTECRPEETGFDSSRLEVLHRHLQRIIDQKIICGAAYCISHKGKIIASASMGAKSKLDASDTMQPDTLFETASITKLFTSVAIMQLVEDGYVRLDTPVGEILDAFKEEPFAKITLWHLLTHTSGIYPDPGCFPEWGRINHWDFLWKYGEHLTPEEIKTFDWVKIAIAAGLRKPIGSEWQYSSLGFAILGEVIRKVSSEDPEKYIMEHIIKPLNMKDTCYQLTPELAKRSMIYSERDRRELQEIIEGKGAPIDESVWSRVPCTGWGLYSTVHDLSRFGNAILYNGRFDGARILGRKSVEKMTTVQLHNVPDHCWGANVADRLYGIGFDMRQGPAYSYSEGTVMHEGAGTCSLDVDPKEELVVAWNVPFAGDDWSGLPLYNVQNIIWSGLI